MTMKYEHIPRPPNWLIVGAISAALWGTWSEAEAELYIKGGCGHSSSIDTLGNHDIGARPLCTAGLIYQRKAWGVEYLHVSDPTARDYGINMVQGTVRIQIKSGWFK